MMPHTIRYADQMKAQATQDCVNVQYMVTDQPTGTCAVLVTPDGERSLIANLAAANHFKVRRKAKKQYAHSGCGLQPLRRPAVLAEGILQSVLNPTAVDMPSSENCGIGCHGLLQGPCYYQQVLKTNTCRNLSLSLPPPIPPVRPIFAPRAPPQASHLESEASQAVVKAASIFYVTGFFLTVSVEAIEALGRHCTEHKKTLCMNLSAPFLIQVRASLLQASSRWRVC